jgi:hypothetical protein
VWGQALFICLSELLRSSLSMTVKAEIRAPRGSCGVLLRGNGGRDSLFAGDWS